MIEETNVDKILKLDLLKTDFFHSSAYPTYLLYNPYSTAQSVSFSTSTTTPSDIYDALTETFLARNVSGSTPLIIPPTQAVMVSITPAGGTVTYNRHRMLINNAVVDYQQTNKPFTRPVRIKALAATQKTIQVNDNLGVCHCRRSRRRCHYL